MIKGIIPALVTPFNRDMTINHEEAAKLLDYTMEGGVHGLFILGTNGEFYAVDDNEVAEYTKFVTEYVKDRLPVFVGLGSNSTEMTIKKGHRLISNGAECFTVITPFFQALTDRELIAYYTEVADALKTPMLIYNIPARTNINVSPYVVKVLSENKYIVGIKDSSGNMDNLKSYIDASEGRDFSVLCGSDSKILKALSLGATGAVASTSNLIPKVIVGIYDAYNKGDLELAQKCQDDVEPLRQTMHLAGTPAVLKKSLQMIGIDAGYPARPVMAAEDPEVVSKIEEMLKYYKLGSFNA